MNTRELIMKAMGADRLTTKQLSVKSGLNSYTIEQLAKNNQEVSIYALERVLKSLGYQLTLIRTGQLTAVESKQ